MYSASDDERATTSCFFELQEIAPEPMQKTCPEVLFLSSTQPAQSLSQYPNNLKSELLEYQIPKSVVPAIYRSTLLAAPRCCLVGLCINLDNTLTENMISGRVCVK
uniref:Uncharacterized protein n=1 Tax=Opuntia streptacantha TaxID=393608 RepID=A0A7C8Z9U4_OPUST